MPVTVIDKIKQKSGNFKLMDAADVEMSNGKSVEEAVAEAGSGGIIIGNTSNTAPGDVTQALSEGKTVYINHTSNDFGVVFFTNLAIVTGKLIVAGSVIFENDGELYTARLEGNLSTSEWTFAAEPIAKGKITTAVDLSGFETEGIIVETYADGSTNAYTFVSDSENDSTTITDSEGNSTVINGFNTGFAQAEEASF